MFGVLAAPEVIGTLADHALEQLLNSVLELPNEKNR
jgi:hypothetical protein